MSYIYPLELPGTRPTPLRGRRRIPGEDGEPDFVVEVTSSLPPAEVTPEQFETHLDELALFLAGLLAGDGP